MLLTWTTLIGPVGARPAAGVVGATIVLVLVGLAVTTRTTTEAESSKGDGEDPRTWTMPPLEQLEPPTASRVRTVALIALRAYLLGAAALVVVKVVQAIIEG